MHQSDETSDKTRRRRRTRNRTCHCCGQTAPFCWTCRCGFAICQNCMHSHFKDYSCNGITWHCPDCAQLNGFGNQ